MHRRQLLLATGTALTTGCAAVGVSGDREPAAFDLSIAAPDEVSLGDAFDVAVSVTNTGGRRGSYTGTVRTFTGMTDESRLPISVGPLRPGETQVADAGSVVAAYAGGWAVELDEASRPFDVFPVTVDEGTPVQVTDGVRLTVDEMAVRQSYAYRTATGESGQRDADAGFSFVFARVRVENTSTAPKYAPSRSEFAGSSDRGLFPVYFGPERWDEILEPGRPYAGKRRLDPGESQTGWVVVTVSAARPEAVAVVWNRDLVTSPPEAVWRRGAAPER